MSKKPATAPVPAAVPETPAAPAPEPRQRVSVDAVVWNLIDRHLAEQPFRVAYPLLQAIAETGGVQPVKE